MRVRVSSRFFDQPGHEMLQRSIINHHLFNNTYHHRRPQNLQQGLRSFQKLEFQKWIVLNILDKNGVYNVFRPNWWGKGEFLNWQHNLKSIFWWNLFIKNHKNWLFFKWKSKLALKCTSDFNWTRIHKWKD